MISGQGLLTFSMKSLMDMVQSALRRQEYDQGRINWGPK